MIVFLIMFLPAVIGLLAFFTPQAAKCRMLLLLCATLHFILTCAAAITRTPLSHQAVFGLDASGTIFLGITSFMFLMVSIYSVNWLKQNQTKAQQLATVTPAINQPDSIFVGCLLVFLSAMSVVACSQHLGIIWVAIEATTLSSAPLICFHRHHRSLEAAWKYLLICSVGIAMALLGNFFLVISSNTYYNADAPMLLSSLIAQASSLNITWLKAAFVFLLIGYGTKMGLAPMHTWLPDAHSQAPSPISALLSGALLNCAFLGILRITQICEAAGLSEFSQHLLLGFGLFSIAWATIFIARQSDYKRLLAYSSVENMGILALGAGLGKAGLAACLLHAVNHSLTKTMLFLAAGNLLHAFKSKRILAIRGASKVVPITAAFWLAGFFAISGMPPFGTFISKFSIIKAAVQSSNYLALSLFLFFLVAIFIGMAQVFLPMYFGRPANQQAAQNEAPASVVPLALLCLTLLFLGLYVPEFLSNLIAEASGVIR